MKPIGENNLPDPALRTAAEAQLANSQPPEIPVRSSEEILYELRVHQIELEMQNEALRQTQQALEESRERFIDLYEFAPVGYLTLTAHGMIAEINLTGVTLLGRERGKLLNTSLRKLVIAADQNRWVQHFMAVTKQDQKTSIELSIQRGDGTVVQTQLDCVSNAATVRITLIDITERKRTEAMLHQVSRQNEMILEAAGEGIAGVDVEDRITFVNPAALAALGYVKEELLGKHSHAALHHSRPDGSPYPPEDCPMHISLRSGLAVHGREETLWCKDGSALPVLYSSTPMREDDKVVGAVVAFRDISELKRYQAQLERRSNYDELTGLPNRNLLMDRLTYETARCLREKKKLAVLLFNVHRFREINDSLGRAAGDSLLCEIAERLRRLGRKMDTLARSGGNEFVLVGEVAKEEEVIQLARRVLETLSQPFRIEDKELLLQVGLGISLMPTSGESGEILLSNAQAAMYRAMASGGNNFMFYSAEMNAHALEHVNLESDLRRAIEHGELLLYYQPQVNLHDGEIIGMEALLRWRHPVRGLVPPMEFIPLAEATGLMVSIGEWVLRTACAQNRAWQAADLRAVPVAVNVSARQFETQDVVALTAKVLSETGLAASYLELELTESAVMGNADAFIGLTEKLKGLSVKLAIDDFGTGYSSLSYLKRFRLDRLKIDQSFVRDAVQDADGAAIVLAIITLAHSLGLSVIAEGVETEAQLNFLRVRGCDEMQGFYFSKPLPAAEFEQLLRDGRKLTLPLSDDLPSRTLLLVDDEPSVLAALKRELRGEGYHMLAATSAQEGMELLALHEVAVVMSDQRMPQTSGAEFLAKVRVMYPDTVRIILSGYSDLKSITDVINRGEIYKFVEKPWDGVTLKQTLVDAFRHYKTRQTARGNAGLGK